MGISEAGEMAAAITAIAAAAGLGWRYCIVSVYRAIKRKRAREHELLEGIRKIVYQVSPNGAGSMNDAICRIEDRQIMQEQVSEIAFFDAGVGTFRTDLRGQCVQVSREFQRIVGCDEESALGRGWVNLVAPTVRKEIIQEWDTCVNDRRTYVGTIAYANGSNAEVKAYPLRNKAGDITGFFGLVRKVA